MTMGPGKYDEVARRLVEEHEAVGVVVIIGKADGESGMSVQGTTEFMALLPEVLRAVALELEVDLARNILGGSDRG